MLLTIIAFAVAFFALLRIRALAAEVLTLKEERASLLAELSRARSRDDAPETPAAALPGVVAQVETTARVMAPPPPPAVSIPEAPMPLLARAAPEPIDAGEAAPPALAQEAIGELSDADAPAGAPSFDWESFIGVQGALWMGGVAFLLSGVFFARWTVEQGMLSPGAAIAVLLVAGAGALAIAEGAWRKGFARAASPVSAAGIALLSIACLAANGRYELLSTPAAFAAMVGVTTAGGLLAVRYRAYATAVLSLFTGFALSVALAVGDIAATLVFAYILLVEGAALAVAVKHRWFSLPWMGLAGMILLQARWCWNYLSPETFPVGILIVLVSALFHLFAPGAAPAEDRPRFTSLGAIGTLGAFLFAMAFASLPRYSAQWPLLFALVGLLNAAILYDALKGKRGIRLRTAAFVTAFFLGWWSIQGLRKDSGASLAASTLAAIAIVSLFGLARRLAKARGGAEARELRVLEIAALAAGGGLVLFGTVMVAWGRGSPVGPFLAIATALALILVEVSGDPGRIRGTLFLGALGLAGLTQIWFLTSVNANTLVLYLAGPVVVSLLLSLLARRTTATALDPEAEIAVQASGWIAIGGLFMALRASEGTSSGWPLFLPLSSSGAPLFAALALQLMAVTASVLRTRWTFEVPALLTASALYLHLWQRAYLAPGQHAVAFAAAAFLYLAFLVLPVALPFSAVREATALWVASAMSGVLFFFPMRAIHRSALGDTGAGLLPLALAAVTAATFREVSRRFADGGFDLSLRYRALYATVAFWLVALAIGLQLDRQWATLGWALEAVALAWLSSRIPHVALPVFSSVLYAVVAARLLLNPAVLTYEQRGLPVLNWILLTYGLAALCAWQGQKLLRAVPARGFSVVANGIGLLGLMLLFWLINLEILDFFSQGPVISLAGQSGYAMKLAFSVGWGGFAIVLLAAGVARRLKALRYLSLAFMILTVAKVFLYDLAALGGFFRVFSFFGLAAGLILVSFFYQRFVFRKSA